MNKIFKGVVAVSLVMVFACVSVGCKEQKKGNKEDWEKKYSATASILVTNGAVITSSAETTDKISGGDISASLYLADTVVDILNAPDIYIELADELGEEYDSKQLDKSINVERRSEDTLLIDITCTSSNPDEAVRIANVFAEVACGYIPEFIPSARANVAATATGTKK